MWGCTPTGLGSSDDYDEVLDATSQPNTWQWTGLDGQSGTDRSISDVLQDVFDTFSGTVDSIQTTNVDGYPQDAFTHADNRFETAASEDILQQKDAYSDPAGGACEVVSISAGGAHACALLNNGTVKCWGSNSAAPMSSSILGDGTNIDKNIPVQVLGLDNAISVSAGASHTCSVLEDGGVMCWGYNLWGSLGDGTNEEKNIPVQVLGLDNATSVAAGVRFTCALLEDGAVKCWGFNAAGQLGIGINTYNKNIPMSVIGLSDVILISAKNAAHTCALLKDDTIKCWGDNFVGQLGIGSTEDKNIPTIVPDLTNVVSVSAGGGNTCALLNDNTVKCWGFAWNGQIGDGTNMIEMKPTPTSVVGLDDAIALSVGGHTCALLSDETAKCWGTNFYGELGIGTSQMGDDTYGGKDKPVSVLGLSGVSSISVGGYYTCAILKSCSVMCWGQNQKGQLGNGTNEDSSLPVQVLF